MPFKPHNLLVLLALSVSAYANPVMKNVEQNPEIEKEILGTLEKLPSHKDILTTVFWVGERAKPRSGWSDNLDSAWDQRWKENFGGLDSPVYRKGFFPARFKPKQNPFYFALPFNDISNPDYIETCQILKYFRANKMSRSASVCKNRWIEISFKGKSCYAQWQDVGPVFTNDYSYVFEGETPKAANKDMAGLDVSPAIRDYLNMSGASRSSWRFVDEAAVPHGPWKSVVTSS